MRVLQIYLKHQKPLGGDRSPGCLRTNKQLNASLRMHHPASRRHELPLWAAGENEAVLHEFKKSSTGRDYPYVRTTLEGLTFGELRSFCHLSHPRLAIVKYFAGFEFRRMGGNLSGR